MSAERELDAARITDPRLRADYARCRQLAAKRIRTAGADCAMRPADEVGCGAGHRWRQQAARAEQNATQASAPRARLVKCAEDRNDRQVVSLRELAMHEYERRQAAPLSLAGEGCRIVQVMASRPLEPRVSKNQSH